MEISEAVCAVHLDVRSHSCCDEDVLYRNLCRDVLPAAVPDIGHECIPFLLSAVLTCLCNRSVAADDYSVLCEFGKPAEHLHRHVVDVPVKPEHLVFVVELAHKLSIHGLYHVQKNVRACEVVVVAFRKIWHCAVAVCSYYAVVLSVVDEHVCDICACHKHVAAARKIVNPHLSLLGPCLVAVEPLAYSSEAQTGHMLVRRLVSAFMHDETVGSVRKHQVGCGLEVARMERICLSSLSRSSE